MKLKLIVSPVTYGGTHPLLPPIGVALISNHLRTKGIKVDQDDLDIKVEYDNKNARIQNMKVNLELFNNKELVDNYLFGHNEYLNILTERILNKTSHKGYDLVGFSIVWDRSYSAHATTLALAKLVKEKYDVPIIVGVYSFEQAKHAIETGLVDYCVIGPGEEALRLLCEMTEKGKIQPEKINGLIYKKENRIMQNEGNYPNLCKFPDFEGLPVELYGFEFDSKYTTHIDVRTNKKVLILPYFFSFGCHSNCIFCSQSKSTNFEVKKVTTVVDEIKSLVNKYKTKYFYFLNTNVNISYKYAWELFDSFEKNDVNIFWTDSINFEQTDEKLLQKMFRNGARRLLYGLESPNTERIAYIEKKLTVNHAEAILRKGHELGVWNEIYLIAGLPFETDEEVQNTIRFIQENQECINFINLSRFRLMESKLLSNPERYNIENIRFIATKENKYCDFYSYAFDEKNGSNWEEKVQSTEDAFNSINESFRKIVTPYGNKYTTSNVHLLFYLYSVLEDKKDVENTYIEIMNKYKEFQ